MEKKYQIIYADPPWRYEHPISKSREIENQYPTMNLDDIKALKIPAEDNSVLFLWATAPKLEEAIGVMQSWGFKYRSCAVWDKQVIGMGYWFRNQHELLLVGVRGSFSPPPPEKRISSVVRQKRGEHSAKPEGIRQLIREWYPNENKIELFARRNNEGLFEKGVGWDIWGNEIKSDITLNDNQD